MAGTDGAGRPGYYHKILKEDHWVFVAAPLVLSESDFLQENRVASGKGRRGPSRDTLYRGEAWKDGLPVEGLSLEIPDFNILEGSCRLHLKMGEEKISMILHPVESWTYVKRFNPGRDNTPKQFFVTIELPEGWLKDGSPELRKIAETYFQPADLKLFWFVLEATEKYVYMFPRYKVGEDYEFLLTLDGSHGMSPDSVRKAYLSKDPILEEYFSQELMIDKDSRNQAMDSKSIQKIIDNNREYRSKLMKLSDYYSTLESSTASTLKAYDVFDVFSRLTFLNHVDFPKIKTAETEGHLIVKTNEEMYKTLAQSKTSAYRHIIELCDNRINAYGQLLKAMKEGSPEILSPTFSETYSGYLDIIGFPHSLEGELLTNSDPNPSIPVHLKADPFDSEIPGFLLSLGDNHDCIFLLIVDDIPATIYSSSQEKNEGPIEFKGTLKPMYVHSPEKTHAIYQALMGVSNDKETTPTINAMDVKMVWDGEHLQIEENGPSKSRRVLFHF